MNSINEDLVRNLINDQFPQWSGLEIKPVKTSGHDNRTFHLGNHMSVRMPSAARYVPQVEKEQTWLPVLVEKLSLPIPSPLAQGAPSEQYPFPWSVNQWLAGETLTHQNIDNLNEFAKELAEFLVELQAIDASDGPLAGEHNFHRGGKLAIYNKEAQHAIENNKQLFNTHLLNEIWQAALASNWDKQPVWVHGDVAPGNLLVKEGRLCAVIDFGILGVGDPACDAAMAWTFFDHSSREIFKNVLNMDEATWNRARGWALWKALITYDAHKNSDQAKAEEACTIIQIILHDYQAKAMRP